MNSFCKQSVLPITITVTKASLHIMHMSHGRSFDLFSLGRKVILQQIAEQQSFIMFYSTVSGHN